MMKKYFKALLSCIASIILASCHDYSTLVPREATDEPEDILQLKELFDFKTHQMVKLHVNYGQYGKGVVFDVYTSDPTENEWLEPVFSAFCDENGQFDGKIELPSAVEKVWIFTPAWGLPSYTTASVIQSMIMCDQSQVFTAPNVTHKKPATRAGGNDYRIITLMDADGNVVTDAISPKMNVISNIHSIVTWWDEDGKLDPYGRINDVNNIVDYDLDNDITTDMITDLQYRLWNDVKKVSSKMNNSYLRNPGHINTTLKSGTRLYFTFLDENGWFESSLAYYYYKTDEPPTGKWTSERLKSIKKYIIFPNCSKAGHAPYGPKGDMQYDASYAPLVPRTRIKLLFEAEDGTVTDVFPQGYTIGFMLFPDSFCNNGGKIDSSSSSRRHSPTEAICSDLSIYEPSAKPELSFMSLKMGDRIFYGIEDGKSDKSYDDVLWTIDAEDPTAIFDEERKDVTEIELPQDLTTTSTTTKTYAFEDQWPTGGDYDLNDLIIKCSRSITVSTNNKLRKVVDDFYVWPESGAAYSNAFAFSYSKSYTPEYAASNVRPSISFDKYSGNETNHQQRTDPVLTYLDGNRQTYVLFSNSKAELGNHFIVERRWLGDNQDSNWFTSYGETAIYPFLISQYGSVSTEENGYVEVHIPGHPVSNRAKSIQVEGSNKYYIGNKGGAQYPYALEVPNDFTPVPESTNIGDFYTDFNAWAESKGVDYKNWYNTHK